METCSVEDIVLNELISSFEELVLFNIGSVIGINERSSFLGVVT